MHHLAKGQVYARLGMEGKALAHQDRAGSHFGARPTEVVDLTGDDDAVVQAAPHSRPYIDLRHSPPRGSGSSAHAMLATHGGRGSRGAKSPLLEPSARKRVSAPTDRYEPPERRQRVSPTDRPIRRVPIPEGLVGAERTGYRSLGGQRCAICLDSRSRRGCVRLGCGHVFHEDCIGFWNSHRRSLGTTNQCPQCKADVHWDL